MKHMAVFLLKSAAAQVASDRQLCLHAWEVVVPERGAPPDCAALSCRPIASGQTPAKENT